MPKPVTTAAMSSASIHFGTSRLLTSGTREGAHSGRCEYADDPCPPAWPRAATASAPSDWTAVAMRAHPSGQRSASGARS